MMNLDARPRVSAVLAMALVLTAGVSAARGQTPDAQPPAQTPREQRLKELADEVKARETRVIVTEVELDEAQEELNEAWAEWRQSNEDEEAEYCRQRLMATVMWHWMVRGWYAESSDPAQVEDLDDRRIRLMNRIEEGKRTLERTRKADVEAREALRWARIQLESFRRLGTTSVGSLTDTDPEEDRRRREQEEAEEARRRQAREAGGPISQAFPMPSPGDRLPSFAMADLCGRPVRNLLGDPLLTAPRPTVNLVANPLPHVSSRARLAPADPTYQWMIVIVRRRTIPAGQSPGAAAAFAQGPSAAPVTTFVASLAATAAFAQAASAAQPAGAPPVTTYFTSLGTSTGEAFELRFVNGGSDAVELSDGAVVVEAIQERAAGPVRQEMQTMAGAGALTDIARGYCLEMKKEVPAKNMVFRLAPAEIQQRFEPERRLLDASERLQERGAFTPDSDPEAYGDSIRQWAIWSREQRFDMQGFAGAFVDHTRRNLEAGGRAWSRPIEDAVRGFVPGRWRDIQQVFEAAGLTAR